MRVVIVYESLFGNTREVAEAIGEGVGQARPDAQVACVHVTEADWGLVRAAGLLVVGGPTHMCGMTSRLSRKMGLQAEDRQASEGKEAGHGGRPGAEDPGVRDWFQAMPEARKGSYAAAFDTRVDFPMAGGAAYGIARRLRSFGYEMVAEPEGFIVEDVEGKLRVGERRRAAAWGAGLVRHTVSHVR